MFVNAVYNECFCIINASACAISKLKWVHQGVCCSDDVLFYDPLHGFHHEGGESHRSKVIQSFWIAFLGDGDHCGMFPQLGDGAAVHGALE